MYSFNIPQVSFKLPSTSAQQNYHVGPLLKVPLLGDLLVKM